FEVRHSKMAVELLPDDVSKKRALRRLMRRWADRIPLAIGDDRTDEGMFCAVTAFDGGYGIKIGEGWTNAQYRVQSVDSLRGVLRFWLEKPAGAPCQAD